MLLQKLPGPNNVLKFNVSYTECTLILRIVVKKNSLNFV